MCRVMEEHDDYYHFDKVQCFIIHNDESVRLAFRRDKLYMLSMHDSVNVVCNDVNVGTTDVNDESSLIKVNKKKKENS